MFADTKAVLSILFAASAVLSVRGGDFSLDLRPPAHKRGVMLRAAMPAEEGVLQHSALPAGAAAMPTLAVDDRLSIRLFDDAEVDVVLVERAETPIGGEAFLAATQDGRFSAVVLQTAEGLTVDAQDCADGRVFSVVSSVDGVDVREYDPFADEETPCEPVVPDIQASATLRGSSVPDQPNGMVDILVAYDRPAAAWAREYGGGTTNFATVSVQKMNVALANSGLGSAFRFRLVGVVEVPASGNADFDGVLSATQSGTGVWAAVKAARDKFGADIVTTLIDTGSTSGVVGLGFTLNEENYKSFSTYPYNVCAIRSVARKHTMTHECGHNLGAGHATAVNPEQIVPGPQLYDYSAGYHFTGSDGVAYHTIMAYNFDGFGGRYELAPLFSSSSRSYAGVIVGDSTHNNANTLRHTWSTASAWREQKVPTSWDVFFSPDSGTIFSESLVVTLRPGKAGLPIRYTLDGSAPTSSSPLYDGPITLTEATTICAATFTDGRPGQLFHASYGPEPIGLALDATHLSWTNDSDYPWSVHTDITYDGKSSLRSGLLSEYTHEPTEIETIVEGPTRMSFRYRKHMAEGASFSVFASPADATYSPTCLFTDSAQGTTREWRLVECEIPAGRQRIIIQFLQGDNYYTDDNGNYEFNGIWLDTVQFDALSRPPSISPASSRDEAQALTFSGSLQISLIPPEGCDGVLLYSTDGSDPIASNGLSHGGDESLGFNGCVYKAPFSIAKSTRVRAAFVEPGLQPSVPVDVVYLERHAISPGEWTADADGALAAAKRDPSARFIAVMLSSSEDNLDCACFQSVANDPAFLKWSKANGVYLVVSDADSFPESAKAEHWFWRLHANWTGNASVADLPCLYFVAPGSSETPFATGVAIADGRSKIGTVTYDGTPASLIAGFESVLLASSWTVHFAPNGGTGSMSSQVFRRGVAAPLQANAFSRKGFLFIGWSRSASGAVAYENRQTVMDLSARTAAITLYAVWRAEAYTVVFHENIPRGRKTSQSFRYGVKAALRKNPFKRKGYVFIGWARSASGKVVYKNAQKVVNLSPSGAKVHLYARWAKRYYHVAFKPKGGKGKMDKFKVTYGKSVRLPANKFKRKGYVFAGWARKPGDPVAYRNRQKVANLVRNGSTVTLYAVWKRRKK